MLTELEPEKPKETKGVKFAMIRWGILGTAGIVKSAFLPALHETRTGVAWHIGSRDLARAEQFAKDYNVARASGSYQAVLDDDQVDAIYIPLPNHLHYEWTLKALQTGKAILCEKPLTGSLAQTQEIIERAQQRHALLWEAYAFQFQPQWQRVEELIRQGAIGAPQEIHGTFNTVLARTDDVRWVKAFDGGAFNDLGCYPVHITSLLLKDTPHQVIAQALMKGEVDGAMWGMLTYPDQVQLMMNVSFFRRYDTFTRFVGTEGEIRITKMYHPGARDAIEWRQGNRVIYEYPMKGQLPFTDMLSHIHQVLRQECQPVQLVTDVGLPTAQTMELVRRSWHELPSFA
ncbi:Predicted dehydrogenase [Sulfobacillus thermosulfidooxidans DSM 9293]|uniref:Predicted dehydrogenase n=2 Tax=Sulfobacillus thermosulfidooxidans TaxID=28034 RepID=A0A1W1WDL7_SULTA|nr:Predicted dehydrogenase [Sulfobacillus thermosulfidooxidans DSM 9293]